jgi:hypothetical protein
MRGEALGEFALDHSLARVLHRSGKDRPSCRINSLPWPRMEVGPLV